MAVITNVENFDLGTLSQQTNIITLSGLKNIILKSGKYVGVFFDAIRSVKINSLPVSFADFSIKYSINGKEWTMFVPDGTNINMAYWRIKNKTNTDRQIVENSVAMEVFFEEPSSPIASINMKNVASHTIATVVDGNTASFFGKMEHKKWMIILC